MLSPQVFFNFLIFKYFFYLEHSSAVAGGGKEIAPPKFPPPQRPWLVRIHRVQSMITLCLHLTLHVPLKSAVFGASVVQGLDLEHRSLGQGRLCITVMLSISAFFSYVCFSLTVVMLITY